MVTIDKHRNHTFVICLLLIIALPTAASAQVAAEIDRTSIVIDETLSLTLTKDGTSIFSGPDLQPLEKDFEVLGQSQSSTTQIINGSATSSTQWQITLAPRRTGTLNIPPITVGRDQSNALAVQVVKATRQPETGAEDAPVFMETDVDARSVYVQSQVMLTLRLYWAVEARIADPHDPAIQDALVHRLDDTTFDKVVNGKTYNVFERKYAIFPQKSGPLEIPSIVTDATVPSRQQRSRNFFDPFGQRGEIIRLRSKPETISVLEKPPEYPPSEVWLPASMILIKDKWSNSSQQWQVGESATLNLSITADGLLGEQLPPIELAESAGLKLYQGKAEVENGASGNGIVGVRRESIAFIPTRAGTFELPEIRVPWWNKHLKKIEYAVIPARQLKIKEAAVETGIKALTDDSPVADPVQQPLETSFPRSGAGADQTFWITLFALSVIGWLITLYFLLVTRRKLSLTNSSIQQEKYSATGQEEEKTVFQALSRACRKNDPAAARKAVIPWLQAALPDSNIMTFADAKKALPNNNLLAQLKEIDRVLYDPAGSSMQWRGARLLALVKELRATIRNKQKKRKAHLEKLYK